jgi:hypothetical protein
VGRGKGAHRRWFGRRSGLCSLPCALLTALGLLTLSVVSDAAGAHPASLSAAGPHRGAPAVALRVIPFPGTPDVASGSSVVFSALSPAQLRSVTVTGSRSGHHGGRLESLPHGAGTAFVPRTPFRAGERVRVVARLSSRSAGTASGDPGATRLGFSFQVASPAKSAPAPSDGPPLASAAGANRHFHSKPNLHPPTVSASSDPDTTSGDMFLTPAHTHQKGPMILNSQGQLVWFHRVPHVAFNLEVQSYHGHPVLTWWQGQYGGGGQDVIVGRSYRRIASLRAAHGYQTDPHDFQITPQGTAWVVARTAVKGSLTSVGGSSDGNVWDSVIQEIDIATGKLLWEWHAYGHIPINASHKPVHNNFCDCYHINSVQPLSDGNLLVSSRNTWSIYKISTKTGHILWTLGGKYNQFKLGHGTRFEWQHDAHRVGNTLTLFDDAAHPQEEPQSSAKVLHINVPAKKLRLVKRYTHRPPLITPAQGSTQILPNGNVFVGWGSVPEFSEYSPSGRQIFSGTFALGTTSYRAYRFPWRARPPGRPAVATARRTQGGAYVWVSWNGATNVTRWRVLGGQSASQLHTLRATGWSGFETQITLNRQPHYIEVQALNSKGRVLGTSSLKSLG